MKCNNCKRVAHGNFIHEVYICGSKGEIDCKTESIAAERDRYKAEMKYLAELLEDSNVTICKLCKRLNPQHENCTGCSDLKTRIAALAKIKEAEE